MNSWCLDTVCFYEFIIPVDGKVRLSIQLLAKQADWFEEL